MDTAAEEDQDARLIADMNLALSITGHQQNVTIEREELMRLLELVKQRSTSTPVLDTSFELGISGYDVEMEESAFEFLVKTYRGDNRLLRVSREIVLPMPLREALPVLVAAGIVEEIEGGFRTTPPTTTRKRLMCRMTFSEMD